MSEQEHFNRREFLRTISLTGAGIYLAGCTQKPTQALPTPFSEIATPVTDVNNQDAAGETTSEAEKPVYGDVYLSAVRGENPTEMTRQAVAAVGGIERYVSNGMDVIIKPNICTDYYSFEYGATTNPEVIAALISLSLSAGAKRVRVMDNPFGGTAQSAYRKSGIEEAVIQAGGEMEVMNSNKFRPNEIPDGIDIKEWTFYQDILGLETVADYGFAKILRVAQSSYLTLVDAEHGMHDVDEPKSVTLAIVTNEVKGWYDYLCSSGVPIHSEYHFREGRPHDGFVAVDPEGYFLEFERFNPHPENETLMPIISKLQTKYTHTGNRPKELGIQATVLWLYYKDMDLMQRFYESLLGVPLLVDQGWAKVLG